MIELQNKVAVITGGVSGLGRATAECFVREGARVALFDLNDDLGKQLDAELGDNVIFVRVDVASEASVKAGFAEVRARFGALHVCINLRGHRAGWKNTRQTRAAGAGKISACYFDQPDRNV